MRPDLPEGYRPDFIDRFVRWLFGAPKPPLRERGRIYARQQLAEGRTAEQITGDVSAFDYNDFDRGIDDVLTEAERTK